MENYLTTRQNNTQARNLFNSTDSLFALQDVYVPDQYGNLLPGSRIGGLIYNPSSHIISCSPFTLCRVSAGPGSMTVAQYGSTVFLPAKASTVCENTRLGYQSILNRHIYPVLGDIPMENVTAPMIRKLLSDFQLSGKAHSTTVKLYAILSLLFQMALADEMIAKSPMASIKRPSARKDDMPTEESALAYTVEELCHILDCLEKESLKWQVYVRIMADSGCRRGEVCGLQWEDIDFQNAILVIRHNLQYSPDRGVYVTTPKNGRSRRVDIDPNLLDMLRRMKAEQDRGVPSKWVFTQIKSAKPMFPTSPTRYFRIFGKRYGIENFHPHKLRHTSASIAITNGADVVSVARRLGHSDTSTTLRMYVHANEESIRRAGQVVRDALKEAQKKSSG